MLFLQKKKIWDKLTLQAFSKIACGIGVFSAHRIMLASLRDVVKTLKDSFTGIYDGKRLEEMVSLDSV